MEITLESLGLTQEEITDRIVKEMASRLLSSFHQDMDEDGNIVEDEHPTRFQQLMEEKVMDAVNKAIDEIALRNVLPNVRAYVENLTLTETNQWGEKIKKPATFVEFLIHRAEDYLNEKVSFDGKSKEESGGCFWSETQTRLTHLVHQHLHYSIENAMKEALSKANSAIATSLAETCKMKLAEISQALNVVVKTK